MEFRKFFKARVFKYVFKDSNLVAPHFCREDYRGEAISIGSLMMSVKCIIPLRAPLNPRSVNHLECINTYIYIFMCYISSRRLATMLPFYCAIARSSRHCERKWGMWGPRAVWWGLWYWQTFLALAGIVSDFRRRPKGGALPIELQMLADDNEKEESWEKEWAGLERGRKRGHQRQPLNGLLEASDDSWCIHWNKWKPCLNERIF